MQMWSLEAAVAHYKALGAPQDQSALISLLKEVQKENGGGIPKFVLAAIADGCGVRESFLLAVIRRIPGLRLADAHVLEICAGPNCGKCAALAAAAEKLQSPTVTVKFVPCMRMCGKGPNLKWDGTLYHKADAALLCRLAEQTK